MEIKLLSGISGLDSDRGTVYLIKEALCTTIGKKVNQEKVQKMTDEEIYSWSLKIFVAEHSLSKIPTIRIIDKMDKNIRNQIFRHTKGSPHYFAQSSRPDWNMGKPRDNSEFTTNVMDFNVEAFLAMTKQRLCYRTEKNTRVWMNDVIDYMKKSDSPILRAIATLSVPPCVYRAGCPEMKCCGMFDKQFVNCCIENDKLLNIIERCEKYQK